MSSPFSPNYIEPKSKSKYLKLCEGCHVFRILTKKEDVVSYFTAYEDSENGEKIKLVLPDDGQGETPPGYKNVWAFVVYNIDAETVQIAEFGQKAIKDYLHAIAGGKIKNDWTKFNLQITRSGQLLDTKYTIISDDTSFLTEEANVQIAEELKKINLNSMTKGENPFVEDKKK